MARPQNTKDLLRLLQSQGIRVTGKWKHYKAYCPGGVVTFSKTPSDPRSLLNSIALLRRYGVEID